MGRLFGRKRWLAWERRGGVNVYVVCVDLLYRQPKRDFLKIVCVWNDYMRAQHPFSVLCSFF